MEVYDLTQTYKNGMTSYSEEESFKDPQTYTGIEGIKHLRIDSEMQKKAEEQGIDIPTYRMVEEKFKESNHKH